MKRKILSLLLIVLLPTLFLVGCNAEPKNKLNMQRYFISCTYTLKGTQTSSVTGNINSYLGANHSVMAKYETITLNGDTNWLYGMTLNYLTFEVYSNASGEFTIQMLLTNLTKGSNTSNDGNTPPDPEKELEITFSGMVEANKAKLIKMNINDVVKSISESTNITFTFSVTPDTTYTIQNIQLYGSHK